MKKSFLLFALVAICLVGCDSVDPLPHGVVLTAITHDMGDQSWLELYEYNDAGIVTSVEDQNGLGRRRSYFYGGDRLLETQTIRLDNEQLIFRDSITYNGVGQVDKIYRFSVNGGTDLPLYQVKSMTYNSERQLIEVSSDFIGIDDYSPREVYHWEGGNVVQLDRYNGTALQQEFFLTYDNKVAANLESFVSLGRPEAATRNNIINTDWKDYTGLLDTACKPCTVSYEYSSNGIPTALTTNWSYSATFTYEQLPQANGF
ncbi:MAG: hypothetical protein HEP71_23875 [Roseivirga sp.]|nr:hypothetical protein [Roseivirga sp.]